MTKLDIRKRMIFNFSSTDEKDGVNLGRLVVPTYQRRYEWKDKNIDFLIEELKDFIKIFEVDYSKLINAGQDVLFKPNIMANLEAGIYLGNIVITKTEDGSPFQIIDGQQRLTSIYIMLKIFEHKKDAIIKNDASKMLDTVMFKTIWNKLKKSLYFEDKYGLEFASLSSLNKLDKDSLDALYKSVNFLDFKKTINNKSRYFKIYEKLRKEIESLSNEDKIFCLFGLLSIEFGVVLVENESMAFDLFEKLNSRGMALSQSDLIKNLFLKELSKEANLNKEELWDGIIDDINEGNRINSSMITNFFRWVMMLEEKTYIKKKELFTQYSNKIKNLKEAKSLLNKLSSYASLYKKYFLEKTKEYNLKRDGSAIDRAFDASPTIYKPLFILLAKLNEENKINDNDFIKLVSYLEKQAFLHFTINNFPSKELDKEVGKLIDALDNIGDDDYNYNSISTLFNSHLWRWTIRNGEIDSLYNPLIKNDFDGRQNILQLYKLIEEYKNNSPFIEETNDIEEKQVDIEHLLPKNPSEWVTDKFDEEELKKYNKKIGNIFIVHGSINRSISNNKYEQKLNGEYLKVKKEVKSLKDSKLFKKQMKDCFPKIPHYWSPDLIMERTKYFVNYLRDNKILQPDNAQ